MSKLRIFLKRYFEWNTFDSWRWWFRYVQCLLFDKLIIKCRRKMITNKWTVDILNILIFFNSFTLITWTSSSYVKIFFTSFLFVFCKSYVIIYIFSSMHTKIINAILSVSGTVCLSSRIQRIGDGGAFLSHQITTWSFRFI